MKITLIGQPSVVMSNPNSRHNFFAWPTIERLKNGRIAVSASGFRVAHICPFGKAVIAYSENEGESYTAPAPIIDTPLDDRDAGLLAFGESGLMITSFNNTVSFQLSKTKIPSPWNTFNDPYVNAYLGGITAENEEKYIGSTFRISYDNGITFGELMKSPITSPHGPCELKNGKILWVGRSFSANGAITEHEGIFAYYVSADGSMEQIGAIENIPTEGAPLLSCEPHAIELDDGKIICHIRVQKNAEKRVFTLYQSESEDGGRTWTKPHQILSDLGGAPSHLMKHSSGVLIAVYGYREEPYGIKAMFSYDGGKSWDTDNVIYTNGVSSDLGYPASVELSDGSILTVFYARPENDFPAIIMQQKWRFEK